MKTFISVLIIALLSVTLARACFANEREHHHGQQQAAVTAEYACPMHPEVTGNKGDSCPKCGMFLEKQQQAGYHCPMHPEVTGKKGDSCPKCGMNLEPVAGQKHHHH
ncbi:MULTISPECIES: heavy metal-binding domain-containing protein [Shewanella]|uniref:heavy metal-binding domain-containing protein n=1 Tax=Shewanella TaxID=22 RepID=UPI001AAF51AF|nr:heavy metal-binding domain-containing protein [Shewanella algae]EKT4489226.1 ATPase P [Shewanella algae]MBO2546245.1 ATPase P [Shewanella algae]BCV26193.1 hypothetical protein TUM3811_00530 [Shewanella algae]